jgi:hypothetical protein
VLLLEFMGTNQVFSFLIHVFAFAEVLIKPTPLFIRLYSASTMT